MKIYYRTAVGHVKVEPRYMAKWNALVKAGLITLKEMPKSIKEKIEKAKE